MLALEPGLDGLSCKLAALEACALPGEVQRLPTAIELDHRAEYRAGLGGERFQLRDDGVGFAVPLLALFARIEPLPRKPGHAVVLVLCRVGEFAQALARQHALRRRHTRLRLSGRQREFDQRGFIAHAGDRGAAQRRVPGAARYFDADRVRAAVRCEQRLRPRAVLGVCKRFAQRSGERKPHGGIGFRFPGRGKRSEICATLRSGAAHLRRRVRSKQPRELVRIGRQRRNAENALRRIGVLVQGGA